ncbi:hypothetical protein [Roseinatronobacter alkalisoli]|uniref:Uncharacterized protein n=1 Tax=Roseinatronobacter alkalisoli TaxID=3028235 RepID=A0ABT5TF18_9RHOB|nr:hypothetical protein [Roseinatronobacter sp. HJB301]MDD7973717.1 hypothetical protein [Roseinatronobacter sp. HJB301]
MQRLVKRQRILPPHKSGRDPSHGFILISTLFIALLLISLVVSIQSRALNNQRLLTRLTQDIREDIARDAIHERLRGIVAIAIVQDTPADIRFPLDASGFVLRQDEMDWQVYLQDQAGLPHLYLARPELLAVAFPDIPDFLSRRDVLIRALGAGQHLPRLEMSLAQLRVPAHPPHMVTQSGRAARINPHHAPEPLRTRLSSLPPYLVLDGQPQVLGVRIMRQ